MTTATQHAAPEDMMALLDGELSGAEAAAITEHLGGCAECAAIAEQFRKTSRALAGWTVRGLPERVDARIQEEARRRFAHGGAPVPSSMGLGGAGWRRWAIGGACVTTALLLFAMFYSRDAYKKAPLLAMRQDNAAASEYRANQLASPSPLPVPVPSMPAEGGIAGAEMDAMPLAAKRRGTAGMVNGPLNSAAMTAMPADAGGPMIARTVSLVLLVNDISVARPKLDAILARYHGYAAELTINTPENSARYFSASLRVPAPALTEALAEMRRLGRVQNESQSGEEVTQQHTDLVARLQNARETERRLLAILEQRTGKVEEVLKVEEQISNTRGEIERMEAEQKALEHRVDFASVQLQLGEEYHAELGAPSTPIGTRMHNAIVTGLGNAGSSLLGVVLFFEESGPVMVVWVVVLGAPGWWMWRRYRRGRLVI